MKSIQTLEEIAELADDLIKAQDEAFHTREWTKANEIRNKLRQKLFKHFGHNRTLKGKRWAG